MARCAAWGGLNEPAEQAECAMAVGRRAGWPEQGDGDRTETWLQTEPPRVCFLCLTRFSSREPVPTPGSRRGRACAGKNAHAIQRAASARLPWIRYLKLVSCSAPTRPRAMEFAGGDGRSRPPKPNSPPSANCVDALCSTNRRMSTSVEEFLRGRGVFRHDRVRYMTRTVVVNMCDRPVDAVERPLAAMIASSIFGIPVLRRTPGFNPAINALHHVRRRATSQPASISIFGPAALRLAAAPRAIDQQGLGGAADAGDGASSQLSTIDFAISRSAE